MTAWQAPGRRRSLEIECFFHRHRQSEQRTVAARRPLPVGVEGCLPRPVEVSDNDRVDLRVYRLDPRDGGLDEIERRDIVLLQCAKLFGG